MSLRTEAESAGLAAAAAILGDVLPAALAPLVTQAVRGAVRAALDVMSPERIVVEATPETVVRFEREVDDDEC